MTLSRSDRVAVALMWALVAGLCLLAIFAPWRAVNVVDNRTYVEMVAGVRDHGLPYTQNTWADVLPEAHSSFNVLRDGKLWGQYPPLYPYVAAPALALGGLNFLYKEHALFTALLAYLLFRLGRALTGRATVGTAAAYLAVVGTPVWCASFQTFALPVTLVAVALALLAALRSLEPRRGLAFAALSGALAGVAVTGHLFATLMMLTLGLAIATARPLGSAARLHDAITRGACFFGSFAIALAPLALLNHLRFGTYNPVSYGPCEWRACTWLMQNGVNSSSILRFGAPAMAWSAGTSAALVVARRSPKLTALAVVASAVWVLAWPDLRETLWAMARVVYGYLVDLTPIDHLDQALVRAPVDGGWTRAAVAVKSLLQCSPFLVAAIASRPGLEGPRAKVWLLVAPLLGWLATLALLARFPGAGAFGWPYLFNRYTVYGIPLLAVLAAATLSRMRARHWVGALAIAGVAAAYLAPSRGDVELLRLALVLRAPLVAAAGLGLASLLARRSELARRSLPALATLACGLGIGVTLGSDWPTVMRDAHVHDARLARLEELTPSRFALAGWGPDTDPLLALRAERDIAYVDLIEADDWRGVRKVIDRWTDEGRPIYGAFPRNGTPPFAWPYAPDDVPAERVDAANEYWKIGPPVRRAPP